MSLSTITIFDLPFVSASLNQVVSQVTAGRNDLCVICTPNPEQVVLARSNNRFKQDLLEADLLLPDGVGVIWTSRLLALAGKSAPLRERIAGVDLVLELLKDAAKNHKKVLVIGGRGYGGGSREDDLLGIQKLQTSPILLEKLYVSKGELIAFWSEGYQDVARPTDQENQQVHMIIQKIKPDYVFVALGAPYQERWLSEFRSLLQQEQVQVAMAVGGSFDILLGKLKRAPVLMRTLHIEWLYRLFQEPWRWRRQTKLLLFIKEAVLSFFQK